MTSEEVQDVLKMGLENFGLEEQARVSVAGAKKT